MERHSSWDNLSQKDIASPCHSVKSLLQTSRTNLSPYQTSSQIFTMLDSKKCTDTHQRHQLPDWMKDLRRQEKLLSQKRRITNEKPVMNLVRRVNDTEPSETCLKTTQDNLVKNLEAQEETYSNTTTLTLEPFPPTFPKDGAEIKSEQHLVHNGRPTLQEVHLNKGSNVPNARPFAINPVEFNDCLHVKGSVPDNLGEASQEPNGNAARQACGPIDEGVTTQFDSVENSQSGIAKECDCSIPCIGSCKRSQGLGTQSHENETIGNFNQVLMNENQRHGGEVSGFSQNTALRENKAQLNHLDEYIQSSEGLLEIISTLTDALPQLKTAMEEKEGSLDQIMKVVASMKTTLTDCVSALENMCDTTASYSKCVKHVKEQKLKKNDTIEKHVKIVEESFSKSATFKQTLCVVNDMIEEVEKQNDLVQSRLSHLEKDVTREATKPCNTLVLTDSGRDLQNYRTQAQEDHFYAQKHVEELLERLKLKSIPKCIGCRGYEEKTNPRKQKKKCVSYPDITRSFHKNITEQFSTSLSNSSSCSKTKKTSFKKKKPSQLNIVYSPSPSLYEQDQFQNKVERTNGPNNLSSSDSSLSVTQSQCPYYLSVGSHNLPSNIVSVPSPPALPQQQISVIEDNFEKEKLSREHFSDEKKNIDYSLKDANRPEQYLEKPPMGEHFLIDPNMREGSLEKFKLRDQSLVEQSQGEHFSTQAPVNGSSCKNKISRQRSATEDCASFHKSSSPSSSQSLQGPELEASCPIQNQSLQPLETPMLRSTSSCCVAGKSAADLFQDVEDEFDSLFTNY
ncbi:uncharacterized protein LOC128883519 isoform X2 [Hylaeus volcanicus]|nr:uncharacterized protein LOC128883519 isoform X2 [Hylaeus volcanicus]